MAFLIPTTGHSISGMGERSMPDFIGTTLKLVRTASVHDKYYDSDGIHVVRGLSVIGWVPKAFFEEHEAVFRNNFGLRNVGDMCTAVVDDIYIQNTGKIGLSLIYRANNSLPAQPKQTQPASKADEEQPKMKLPTLQEMLTTNTAAVTTAAQLETGRVASKQLAKIVGKKLKPEHAALLETPIGQAVLANGVILLGKSLYPDNDLLKKVSNAMLVSSLQELLQSFDIPGIIGELLDDKSVLKAALKEKDGE